MRQAHLSGVFLFMVFAIGCSGPDEPASAVAGRDSAPVDANVVGKYIGGEITFSEVDAAIVRMSVRERAEFSGQNLAAFEDLIRELAATEILRQEATSSGFSESAEYVSALGEMRRQVLVHQVLQSYPLDIKAPTEVDVRTRYDKSLEQFGDPERRFVLTIFRRVPAGNESLRQDTVAEMEAYRRRVLQGESFAVLASENGDSEARISDGAIGWVQKGSVSDDLWQLLASLEEEVPSEPVVTASGVHLFYVDTIVEGRIPEFDAVRNNVYQMLVRERRALAIQDLVHSTRLPESFVIPDLNNVSFRSGGEAPDEVLLRVDGFVLDRRELQKRVLKEVESVDFEQRSLPQLALTTLRALTEREVLAYRFSSEGYTLQPIIQERFSAQAEEFLVQRYSAHLMETEVERHESQLRDFQKLHKNRFVSPLKFRLKAVFLKQPDNPVAAMAELEENRGLLERGELTLEQAAKDLSGTVETSEWVTIGALTIHRPRAAYFAPSLRVGEYSAPYSNGAGLEMFQVIDRRDPVALPFDEVRERVVAEYMRRHGQKLYDKLVAARLERAAFEVYPEHISQQLARQDFDRSTALNTN